MSFASSLREGADVNQSLNLFKYTNHPMQHNELHFCVNASLGVPSQPVLFFPGRGAWRCCQVQDMRCRRAVLPEGPCVTSERTAYSSDGTYILPARLV